MESFKGSANIVNVEDYKVIVKADGVGWDIYIRMELLTPLNTYIKDRILTEKDVIRLGCDICSALERCAMRNVIHRDIKPDNIFVNEFGDYKLGDFGIARQLESVSGSFSQKGTYNYMAPEVVKSGHYDATVDIYSLGIVLYMLMNRRRRPFMSIENEQLTPGDLTIANQRRFNGETLPAPCDASPQMAAVILTACDPDPGRRFTSATAMKNALLSVGSGMGYGTYTGGTSEMEQTRRMPYGGSSEMEQTRRVPYGGSSELSGSDKSPNLRGAIILACVLVIAAAAGGIGFYLYGNGTDHRAKKSQAEMAEESSAADAAEDIDIADAAEDSGIAYNGEGTSMTEEDAANNSAWEDSDPDAEPADEEDSDLSEDEDSASSTDEPDKYYFGGHTYAVYDQSIGWTPAKEACEYVNGHLATVTNYEEEEFIKSIVGSRAFYWLGGYKDDESGDWFWVTGEPWGYTDWSPGQPDNYSAVDGLPQGFLVFSTSYD